MHNEMQTGLASALLPPRHALQWGFQVSLINEQLQGFLQSLCGLGKADAGRLQWSGWMPQQWSCKLEALGLSNSQGCSRRVLGSRDSMTFSSAHMPQTPWWPGADPLQATRETFSTPGEVPTPCGPTGPLFPGHTTLCWLLRGRKNTSVDKEKADFWFAAPRRDGTGTKWETMSKPAAEAQHLAVFPIRTCRAHFAVARAHGACCCCCFYK